MAGLQLLTAQLWANDAELESLCGDFVSFMSKHGEMAALQRVDRFGIVRHGQRAVLLTRQAALFQGFAHDPNQARTQRRWLDKQPLMPRLPAGESVGSPSLVGALEAELRHHIKAGLRAEQRTVKDMDRHIDLEIAQYQGDWIRLTLALALPMMPIYDESFIRARSPDAAESCPLPPDVAGEAHDVYRKHAWVSWSDLDGWPDDSIGLAQRLRTLKGLTLQEQRAPKLLRRSWAAACLFRAFAISHVGRTSEDVTLDRVRGDVHEALDAAATYLRPWARAVQQSLDGSGLYSIVRHRRLPTLEALKAAELVATAPTRGAIGCSNIMYEGVSTAGAGEHLAELEAALDAFAI